MAVARAIRGEAARRFNLSVHALESRSRQEPLVWARHLAMHAIRKHCPNATFKDVGRMFGGRDHSTARFACAAVEDALATPGHRHEDATAFAAWCEEMVKDLK